MPNKFGKEELLEAIDSRLNDLTENEIKELIEKELSKESDQIDMDYIDLCYDILETKRSGNVPYEIRKAKLTARKPAKAFLIAAIVAAFAVSTLTASAFVFDIPAKIAQYRNGNAEIDFNLENADITADGYALLDSEPAKQLAEFGITPVTLPEEMIKENCEITNIENQTQEESVAHTAEIEFEFNGKYGFILIEQFAKDFEFVGEFVAHDINSGQMINANGMDILVLEHESGLYSIIYKDNSTHYDISLYDSDIDTAMQFARSIK